MKVINITIVAVALFFTSYTSLSTCPVLSGHQHADSDCTHLGEFCDQQFLLDEIADDNDDEDD